MNGSGSGDFTSVITGLVQNTIYHIRAYATNCRGTGYGDDIEFTTDQPEVFFLSTGQTVGEASGTTTIMAGLSTYSQFDVVINFTVSVSAVEGTDDSSITRPITITDDVKEKEIEITINEDFIDENDETIVLTLGEITNGKKGTITEHTVTITDNDDSPSVNSVSANTADGAYKQGDVIEVSITFDVAVEVTGTPKPVLETGDVESTAGYRLGKRHPDVSIYRGPRAPQ